MAIYVCPFDYDNNILDVSFLRHVSLYVICYRSPEGPLGFESNVVSEKLLQELIGDSTWYDIKDNIFYTDKDEVLHRNIYVLRGLFLADYPEIDKEIALSRELHLTIKKNEILRRHNKPTLPIRPNLFLQLSDNGLLSADLINMLLFKKVNFMIGKSGEFGNHLITPKDSTFMQKLAGICLVNNEKLNIVSSVWDVPSW